MSGADYTNCLTIVEDFFAGDTSKAIQWMATPNPMLGDIAPQTMIEFGRTDRLMKFLRMAAEERE